MFSEIEEAVGRVVEVAAPSVVRIGRGWGRGAGVVFTPGHVVTNAHNLRGDETTVTFPDGRSVTGNVAGIDPDGDLAVLTVDTGEAPALPWVGGDGPPALGTPVFTVTHPAGSGPRVTFGAVSAIGQAFRGPRGRRIGGGVEHTAPLGRGSSGSPVLDGAGALLGINTNRAGDGFYQAIPATAELRARLDALARGDAPRHPRLGVALAPGRAARRLRAAVGLPERDGVLVRGVQDSSPAATAGIREGDLLVQAGGTPLTTADDLYTALDGWEPPAPLEVRVVRGVEELTVSVPLAG